MAKRTSAAFIAALFTLAGSAGIATAQTATETPAPAAEAAATPAAPAAAAPAAPTEPQVGQPYAKETHGDWTLRCMKTETGADPCELYQLLKDAQDSPVAEASVIPMNGGKVEAVITFVAPLETDLSVGLGLQVDAAQESRYPFMLCARVGCISRVGLEAPQLDPLKRGNAATVSVLPFGAAKEEMVKLPLSLSGFTAGMTALVEANKAATAAAPEAHTAAPLPVAPGAATAPAPAPQQ